MEKIRTNLKETVNYLEINHEQNRVAANTICLRIEEGHTMDIEEAYGVVLKTFGVGALDIKVFSNRLMATLPFTDDQVEKVLDRNKSWEVALPTDLVTFEIYPGPFMGAPVEKAKRIVAFFKKFDWNVLKIEGKMDQKIWKKFGKKLITSYLVKANPRAMRLQQVQEYPPDISNCLGRGTRTLKAGSCWLCKKPGHMKLNCPKRSVITSQRPTLEKSGLTGRVENLDLRTPKPHHISEAASNKEQFEDLEDSEYTDGTEYTEESTDLSKEMKTGTPPTSDGEKGKEKRKATEEEIRPKRKDLTKKNKTEPKLTIKTS